jgi:glycosyltransferase involved in cell wall biosynthesis
MPRIGINALYLIPGGVGGTEVYLRELLKALAEIDTSNEYFVFTNMETGAGLVPKQANFLNKPQAVHARFRPARILWEQTILPLEAARYRLDVLFNPGFSAPIFTRCPNVTTIHDLQHKRHPEYFRWFDLPFWKLLVWAAIHRSRALIAVSQATRKDILRYYKIPEASVHVIYHGADQELFTLRRTQTDPLLLCVSTLHPHKNLERLIRAFAKTPRPEKLVLAGVKGFRTKEIESLVAELKLEDRVQITGWISREELLGLFARARAFIYPSTFEGFGMPVLEALAAGIPVACSRIPPLEEVAGEAALYFDPLNEQEIETALGRILTDQALRSRLEKAGPQQADPFRWSKSAAATRAVLLASARKNHGDTPGEHLNTPPSKSV